jgi:hypothetical protein
VKLIAAILGIYIMVLPCLPCMDGDECNEPIEISVAQTADQHQHENSEEACGPFCNCICCGNIVSQNFQMLKIAAEKPLPAKKIQSYYNNISLSSDFFGNIWQPPRLV